MNTTTSVIIDDEPANRQLLQHLLERHCPSTAVRGCASSVAEGYELILESRPDIVFLDIRMPGGEDGFDLLRMFEKPEFIVIFVTSYDEFAIHAFEFNAVDYILKPIDYMKLIRSVERAARQIALNVPKPPFVQQIELPHETAKATKSLSFHLNDRVSFIDTDQICYIRGTGNYCEVVTARGQRFHSARTLAYYEEQLQLQEQFIRISKRCIININYILSYTKGSPCFIEMKNNDCELEVSRRKKQYFLQFLKNRNQDVIMR